MPVFDVPATPLPGSDLPKTPLPPPIVRPGTPALPVCLAIPCTPSSFWLTPRTPLPAFKASPKTPTISGPTGRSLMPYTPAIVLLGLRGEVPRISPRISTAAVIPTTPYPPPLESEAFSANNPPSPSTGPPRGALANNWAITHLHYVDVRAGIMRAGFGFRRAWRGHIYQFTQREIIVTPADPPTPTTPVPDAPASPRTRTTKSLVTAKDF